MSPDKGRDRLYGDGGQDSVQGRGRGSAIGGGAGDDYLISELGAEVHGGPGNDEIVADLVRRRTVEIDGGDGRRDIVSLRAPKSEFPRGSRYVIDVPRERVTVNGAKRARYEGIEDTRFSGRPGRLTYLGGPGRDLMSAREGMQVKAYGRRGPDILIGGARNDLLDGGPGRDAVVGGAGRDRCINAEQRRQCEVRR
jgi:Ca2+-binding RTX toxin-like protein